MSKYIITKVEDNGTSNSTTYNGFDELRSGFIADEMGSNSFIPNNAETRERIINDFRCERLFWSMSHCDLDIEIVSNLKRNGYRHDFDSIERVREYITEAITEWLDDEVSERISNYFDSQMEDACDLKPELCCPRCGADFTDCGVVAKHVYFCDVENDGSFDDTDCLDNVIYECGDCGCEINLERCGLEC